jgi:hypothetical protein
VNDREMARRVVLGGYAPSMGAHQIWKLARTDPDFPASWPTGGTEPLWSWSRAERFYWQLRQPTTVNRRYVRLTERGPGNLGFAYLAGHGVDQGLIDDTFAEAGRFFAWPADHKAEVSVERSPCDRGWFDLGMENLDPDQQEEGDLKDRQRPDSRPSAGPQGGSVPRAQPVAGRGARVPPDHGGLLRQVPHRRRRPLRLRLPGPARPGRPGRAPGPQRSPTFRSASVPPCPHLDETLVDRG